MALFPVDGPQLMFPCVVFITIISCKGLISLSGMEVTMFIRSAARLVETWTDAEEHEVLFSYPTCRTEREHHTGCERINGVCAGA